MMTQTTGSSGFASTTLRKVKFLLGATSIIASPFVVIVPIEAGKFVAAGLLGLNGLIHLIDGATS